MKTLELFNGVIAKETTETKPLVHQDGYIIERGALWATDKIINYYNNEKLNGNDLNKTFHKSWSKIKNSSRFELLIDQINHYLSTYGTNFTSEVYIPNEVLEIPDIKLTYKVIKAYTKEELIEKSLNILRSGIALKEETIDYLVSLLVDELDYKFTGKENIKNKEAIVKLAELYNIYSNDPVEFFRYIIYRTTGDTLLIKNKELIDKIKDSSYNPSTKFKDYGLERLAEIFNRFKPLFLAYKNRSGKTINKISKLSKTYHRSIVINTLNEVTQKLLTKKDSRWLDSATVYAIFKALTACYTRMNGQDSFVYRIRNSKSWTTEKNTNSNICEKNFNYILSYLKERINLKDKTIYIPKDVKYALPTSEKMFVGDIPTGTRFYGKKLAVGIYWENSWGARDLDLSGINIGGKVGWNSSYNQGQGQLMFSGDITNAPKGAVEYLYANNGLNVPTLIYNNIYYGNPNSGYKIIIGKGDKISKDYMMNPENLFADIKTEHIQNSMVIGMIIPKKDEQCFILLNFGAGHVRVSGNNKISNIATKALYQQWNKPLSLNKLLKLLDIELSEVNEDVDIDLSLENLEKDSFIKLFQTN